ncbi:MAG: zinc-binding dehydrogenase [Nitrospinota bacterium]
MATAAIPSEMDALVLTGPGAFEGRRVPVPEPGPMEVLCRVHSIAIDTGTDSALIAGAFREAWGWPPYYPITIGHEWAGEIVALGEGVFDFKPGDRISAASHKGCGWCRNCYLGRYTLCLNYGREDRGHKQYGHSSPGAYSEYFAISVKSIYPIPDSLSYDEASLVDPAAIALHSAKRAKVGPGDTVAVFGPGGIGLLSLQCAAAMGAGRVIVIGRGDRLKKAAEFGAETIDFEAEDPVKKILDVTDGIGVDAVIETAGTVQTCQQAIAVTRKGGRICYTGVTKGDIPLPLGKITLNELDVYGLRANPNTCPEVIPLIVSGRIQIKPLITHTFPLSEFAKGLETAVKRIDGAIRVIIHP